MTLHKPLAVGSTPHEAPEVVWEVLVEVAFEPRLSATEVDRLRAKLWDRLNEAIKEVVGPLAFGAAGPTIVDLHGRGADTPVFPMVAGGRRFTSSLDIEEMIERRCRRTVLAEVAYDATGRAYELGVAIQYHRRPHGDGEQRASMPDPQRVERTDSRRPRSRSR